MNNSLSHDTRREASRGQQALRFGRGLYSTICIVALLAACGDTGPLVPVEDVMDDATEVSGDVTEPTPDTDVGTDPADPDADVDPGVDPDVDRDVDPDADPDVDPDVDPDADVDPDVDPDAQCVPLTCAGEGIICGTLDTTCGDTIFCDLCDDGDVCDASLQLCVDESEPRCGDGVVDDGEACDDGVDNSDTEPDACRLDCTLPRCGDGVVDEGEACDDGNDVNNDECTNQCTEPVHCDACDVDEDCGSGAICFMDGCAVACDDGDETGCPEDYTCTAVDGDDPDDPALYFCIPEVGSCFPDLCEGVACDDPDDAFCDGDNVVTYDASGTCATTDGAPICTYGTTSAACDSPPEPHCESDVVLRIYEDGDDDCSDGACVYAFEEVSCLETPESTCATDGAGVITYESEGSCAAGACVFGPTTTLCDEPPSAMCDGNVLITYATTGTCDPTDIACAYVADEMDCSAIDATCEAGACVPISSACVVDDVDDDLGSALGTPVATGTTVGASNDFVPSCVATGSGTAPDVTYLWTAPSTGCFVFNTSGSAYDTALALLSCDDGTELECNDDVGFSDLTSSIEYTLTEGERVVVVVDGFGSAAGAYELNILPCEAPPVTDPVEEITGCPEEFCVLEVGGGPNGGDLYTYTIPADRHPVSDDITPSCGTGELDGRDLIVTLDTTRVVSVSLDTCIGPDADSLIAIYGDESLSDELDCNDDVPGPGLCSTLSEIEVTGDVTRFVIDEYSQRFYWNSTTARTFQIELNYGAARCAIDVIDDDLGSALGAPVATGTTAGATNDFAPSCVPAHLDNAPDVAYLWTAPSSGCFAFDTSGSAYDTALTLWSCDDGSELDCNDDVGGAILTSRLELSVTEGEQVVVVIDGYDNSSGAYELNIQPCEAPPVTDPVEEITGCPEEFCILEVGGGPNGGDLYTYTIPAHRHPVRDDITPSCGIGHLNGLDLIVTLDTAGVVSVSLDTCIGPDADSLIAIYGDESLSDELDCNDDVLGPGTCSTLSEIEVTGDVTRFVIDEYGHRNYWTTTITRTFQIELNYGAVRCAIDEIDDDLGSALGTPVATGTTAGATNDFGATCVPAHADNGRDVAYLWTAPSSGCFEFDTSGSAYDTVLTLWSCDDGSELDCNDDVGVANLTSRLELSVTEGEQVVVVVDGYDNSSGAYELNIQPCD